MNEEVKKQTKKKNMLNLSTEQSKHPKSNAIWPTVT